MSPSNHAQLAATAAAAVAAGLAYAAYRHWHRNDSKRELPETWTKVGTLDAMFLYPVKSCAPIVTDAAETSALGLRQAPGHVEETKPTNKKYECIFGQGEKEAMKLCKQEWCRDRTLMVIDEKDNFITSRQKPQLFLVQPALVGSALLLRRPGAECQLDLAEVATRKTLKATVWGEAVQVVDCGADAEEFFTELLGQPARLVYWPHQHARTLRASTARASRLATPADPGAFPDETAYNIVNQASVDDLNGRLENDHVTHRNFRPSLVVRGPAAYEEDNWRWLRIGESVFEVLKPCLRCVMTTMDPETGVRSPNNEPVRTLEGYRTIRDPEQRRRVGGAPRMGLQMALRRGDGGRVAVGDDVYVA